MLYLNTIASVALDDLARERARHEKETRIPRALAAPAKRPALVIRQETVGSLAPERVPRWRITLPWRVDMAEAA